ncbi:hypothetical protein CRE_30738 [Caenorhabditis remanei]|uniref:Uncharacterized protein n=1 Tax=Caenorhabditis remanei TaxID=31234 RepID=E3LU13_CAERE|nr:hypothetical protein CRE_30738 [Caenorhabditis remanei]
MFNIMLPKLTGCPFTLNVLDFCKTTFNACLDKKADLLTCKSKFFDCTETPLPPAEKHCAPEVANVCRLLKNAYAVRNDTKSPFEWHVDIRRIVDEIGRDCGIEINTIGSLYQFVSNDKCTQKYKAQLDKGFLELDKKTSMDLQIPADRFRCGWHFGYIGNVFARYWILNSCGHYAIDFNHICSKHYNCYLKQKDKKICDQEYESDRKNLVYGMQSFKDSCQQLIYNKTHEIFQPSENVYKVFEKSEIETKILSFNGKLDKPLSILDTENLNFTTVKVFDLSPDGSLDLAIRDMFNVDIYKNGWASRVIIDSSAMVFEDCRRNNQLRRCLDLLVFSISKISDKPQEFVTAINKFNQTISDLLASPPTKSEIEDMINHNFWWFEIFFVIQYLVMLAIKKLVKCWKRHPPTPPSNGEEVPLQNSPEEGLGSSSMASVNFSVASDTVVVGRCRPEEAEAE